MARDRLTKCEWSLLFVLLPFLSALWMTSQSRAEPIDPTTILFDKSCPSQVLEIEIWNRLEKKWDAHPDHPLILAGSCQVEDAGYLMNEIRVRCLRTDNRTIEPWTDGIKVYSAGIVDGCTLPQARTPMVEIHSPAKGEIIRNETRLARVEGRIFFETVQKTPPRSEAAARLLADLILSLPQVQEVRVENLTEDNPAVEVAFEPNGDFSALVGLRTGDNLIRVTVIDENNGLGEAVVPVVFDIGKLREKWLRVERERIERFRAEQRDGQVDVEAVDP